jgi:nucleoside-diphosphate-sugar epimerase
VKRIIVTGATGFIGRHCVPLLIERGYEVHGIGRHSPPDSSMIEWHRADLLEEGVPAALAHSIGATHLLHLGWCASPNEYLTSPINIRWVSATAELAAEFVAAGGRRFAGAGSCAEYAESDGPCREYVTPLKPASLYGQSKVAAYQRLSELAANTKVSFAWGRIFFPYGPYQASERLIPTVIAALLRRKPLPSVKRDEVRDFIHVQDVAEAFVAMVEGEARGLFNVGSGAGVSVGEVISILRRIAEDKQAPSLAAARQSGAARSSIVADAGRISGEFGWRPHVTIEDGLADTVAWWRERLAN